MNDKRFLGNLFVKLFLRITISNEIYFTSYEQEMNNTKIYGTDFTRANKFI